MVEQHRMDLVEAMVPGMSGALVKVFGEAKAERTSSANLAETNASMSLPAKMDKVRTLIREWQSTKKIDVGGQWPGLIAYHPMLSNSHLRHDYENAKCPGVPETKLVTES